MGELNILIICLGPLFVVLGGIIINLAALGILKLFNIGGV